MPQTMKAIAAASLAGTAGFGLLYQRDPCGTFLTLAITCGTIFYHFGIRLAVGWLYQAVMNNRADYTRGWYQLRPWEKRLYETLKVKRWKNKLPTYAPETFSPRLHSWNEIAQTMCQAELVHETNALLSFCPLIAVKWFGSMEVFLITSILAAAFDLMFVMTQRYNRPRIIRLAVKQNNRSR
ncbi:hypothetical protein N510_002382 [Firmicutes bacterium ASF500]|nr:hypothetical protein N510_002382 [Firmicutes bacterium ASF500]